MHIDKIALAKALNKLKRESNTRPEGPKGLPESRENENNYTGTYENESLTDPGFNHNGVVGTGDGPVIGVNRRN